ncbi:hypothetical protein HDV00_003356 [Rhizophlyctis rosea]|nr:hypothetical protein HDV00_003356 [Rhizophlyctis rosea]
MPEVVDNDNRVKYILGAAAVGLVAVRTFSFVRRRIDPVSKAVLRGYVDESAMAREQLEHAPIRRACTLLGPAHIVIGQDAGKWLLVKNRHNLAAGREVAKLIARSQGKKGEKEAISIPPALPKMDGPPHDRARRTIAPAFRTDALVAYLPKVQHVAGTSLDQWVDRCKDEEFIEIEDSMKEVCIRIAPFKCESSPMAFTMMLGARIPDNNPTEMARLRARYAELFIGLLPWPLGPKDGKQRVERAMQGIRGDVTIIIKERMAALEQQSSESSQPNVDPLWLLVKSADDSGNKLTVDELASHAIQFVIAGQEGTSMLLTSFIVEFIKNPDLVTRLRSEQAAFTASTGRTIPTFEDFKQMPLLEATFREVERLHPVEVFVMRKAKEELKYDAADGKSYTIPKDSVVLWDFLAANRDPIYYPSPDTFNPDRWLRTSAPSCPHATPSMPPQDAPLDIGPATISPFRLASFGAGHRICIGMQFARMLEMAVGSLLVREYEFSTVKAGIRLRRTLSTTKPILHYVDGVWVKFGRRAVPELQGGGET